MNENKKIIQSKLFKLKKWLTVPEAAQHLSRLFEETVSEADVLQLALDNHLKISVNFVNQAYVKRGKVVSREDAEWYPPDSFVANFLGTIKEILPKPVLRSLRIDEEHFINLEDEVSSITGVWDLSMIGNELLDIQHKYQMLTGGPEVTLIGIDGPFVDGQDGLVWQIQERFDDPDTFYNEDQFTDFDRKNIANGNITKERLLEIRKERKIRPLNDPANYYPADGLPKDSVLVVRTQALLKLQENFFREGKIFEPLAEIPFLNTTHAFHAKELRIAVEAWKALYEENPPLHVPQGGHKKYITKWLEENHPTLGQRARDRISTVINPNPKGGASPILE